MSDNSERNGSSRGRRGGQNRRRGGGGSGGYSRSRVPRSKKPEPSGFSKFLNTVSFGLLGEAAPPQRKPRPKSKPPAGASDRSERRPRNRTRREPRSAKPEDVHTERLYVGNLSYDATESDLFELFNGVGAVQNAEVVVNSRTQRSKGFAFVTMASLEEARRAVEVLGGQDFMGRPLQLSGAKPISRRNQDDSQDEPKSESTSEESSDAPAEVAASVEDDT